MIFLIRSKNTIVSFITEVTENEQENIYYIAEFFLHKSMRLLLEIIKKLEIVIWHLWHTAVLVCGGDNVFIKNPCTEWLRKQETIEGGY